MFLFCYYPNHFQWPLKFWSQYFSWSAERHVHLDYFQGQTQNVFFMHVQNVTHREEASVSTPGRAASSAIAKHDLCLWLTEKAVQCIIPLSFTYFTWLFECFMAWFPDHNSQSYHFSCSLHSGQSRKLDSSCLSSSRRCWCFSKCWYDKSSSIAAFQHLQRWTVPYSHDISLK